MIDLEPKIKTNNNIQKNNIPHPTYKIRSKNTLDYSLTGKNSKLAIELGLAEADWYQSPVPKAVMKTLLTRKDSPAIEVDEMR